MDYEEIIKHLGGFGLYQKRIYYLICILSIFDAAHLLLTVFTLGNTGHRCAIPGLKNDTFDWSLYNGSVEGFVYDNRIYKECTIYSYVDGNITKCDSWVYDRSTFKSSLVSQMDIVCEKQIQKSHAQMLIMLGMLVGGAFIGPLADTFGRKKMLCISLTVYITAPIAVAWAPNMIVVFVLYFLTGVSISGAYTPAFVLGLELVSADKRVWTGMITQIFWAIGLIVLSMESYLIRHWQYLQLAASVPGVIMLSYFCFVAESPRWLISKGRLNEALEIIRYAAKVNKVVLPENLFQGKGSVMIVGPKTPEIFSMLKSKRLMLRIFIVYFNWMACSLTFYGIVLNAGNLSGSVHMNFFLLSVIELPAYFLCVILLDRIGRKLFLCTSFLISGVSMIFILVAVLFAAQSWITTVLAVIGKFGVTMAFVIVWIYTSELFPTNFRNSAVGSGNMMARVGAAIAPYVANLEMFIPGQIGKVLPIAIFGLTALASGFLALLLPETKSKRLPDSVEDAEKL